MSEPRFITAAEAEGGIDTTKIDDVNGVKAIDLTTEGATGRALFSNDGTTVGLQWQSVDAGTAQVSIGPGFDFPAQIAMVDPSTFGLSADTSVARAVVFVNFVFADTIKLTPLASPPASPTEGDIYAGTDHHLYYYNGTTWKQSDNA